MRYARVQDHKEEDIPAEQEDEKPIWEYVNIECEKLFEST